MKADQLINGVLNARYPQSIVMPNYTPKKWWECDVLELTKSGYWIEFEIKISRSDFLADARKQIKPFAPYVERMAPELYADHLHGNKHEILATKLHGPNRFYFVTKKGIVTESDIPEWAGWMETQAEESSAPSVRVIVRKRAPIRHKDKLDGKVVDHMKTCAYHRFIQLRTKMNQQSISLEQ